MNSFQDFSFFIDHGIDILEVCRTQAHTDTHTHRHTHTHTHTHTKCLCIQIDPPL